ncbi:hypothetical protein, partial [Aestuariivirga sp.]|uniref:hypothetical protein n=1 Tax=Aestuariivirga sp. TaxID=2650926 RepID=UPI003018312E
MTLKIQGCGFPQGHDAPGGLLVRNGVHAGLDRAQQLLGLAAGFVWGEAAMLTKVRPARNAILP